MWRNLEGEVGFCFWNSYKRLTINACKFTAGRFLFSSHLLFSLFMQQIFHPKFTNSGWVRSIWTWVKTSPLGWRASHARLLLPCTPPLPFTPPLSFAWLSSSFFSRIFIKIANKFAYSKNSSYLCSRICVRTLPRARIFFNVSLWKALFAAPTCK